MTSSSIRRRLQIEDTEQQQGLILLFASLLTVVIFHGGLLPFTHENTYDAFIHMFFGSSYAVNWFDPWESRWYTGFVRVSYPPGTHMLIAMFSKVFSLRISFVIVQTIALLIFTLGVFRFSLIWVGFRAAGFAALSVVLSSGIALTVHVFGQLPTIYSLGMFLNTMPSIYRWVQEGGKKNLAAAAIMSAGTTSLHHVTTLFGLVFFVLPVVLQALMHFAHRKGPDERISVKALLWPVLRASLLGIAMIGLIVLTVFPYWYWSITDPITQVPIPHGSRENFLVRTDLGMMFFIIPWGLTLLLWPFLAFRALKSCIWPLAMSLILASVLGTGGTTPVPRIILGGAFDILTLDRFTFWATVLCAPVMGYFINSVLFGPIGQLLRQTVGRAVYWLMTGLGSAGMVAFTVAVVILPEVRPTQPDFIEPDPIVQFLAEDNRDAWRYLTLGFGDQFAYVSAMTPAYSVDGNYHSARRLPNLTRYSVERLENSKYMGVPGLGSLEQFLVEADRYNLKYVFSNDQFYDPLLHFTGWQRSLRLSNGIVVWEKQNIPPVVLPTPRAEISNTHSLMWGIIPPMALFLAHLTLGLIILRGSVMKEAQSARLLLESRATQTSSKVQARIILALFLGSAGIASYSIYKQFHAPESEPQEVIESYYNALDFRNYQAAYGFLSKQADMTYDEFVYFNKLVGGLYNSYSKLQSIKIEPFSDDARARYFAVDLEWLSSVKMDYQSRLIATVLEDGHWRLLPPGIDLSRIPTRLLHQDSQSWFIPPRRQAPVKFVRPGSQIDRPRVDVAESALVSRDERLFSVALVRNSSSVPAAVLVAGALRGADEAVLDSDNAGIYAQHQLLPHEIGSSRIEYQGILSLSDAELARNYDPTLYIPPMLDQPPVRADLTAEATAISYMGFRGLAVHGLRARETENGLRIVGEVVNSGVETASVVRILLTFFDEDGVVWVDGGFLGRDLPAGRSDGFSIEVPNRDSLEVIARKLGSGTRPGYEIALNGAANYTGMSVQLEGMTFDGGL